LTKSCKKLTFIHQSRKFLNNLRRLDNQRNHSSAG
jgi:hypothetical protein